MKRSYLLLGLALAGCGENAAPKGFEMPPAPVSVAEIAVRDVPLYFEEMGTISPNQTAEVKPQVSGMIMGMHFKQGDMVKEGDLLYTIDEAPYMIKVQEAEALLFHNLANLHNAEKKLERYKSLSKQDLIAKVDFDELETKVILCQAIVRGDEARLATAKLDLEHCRVLAPITGRAGKSTLQAGNMVSAGASLITLSQENPMFVDFTLTEKELLQLPTMTPSLEVFAAGGEELLAVGEVTFLDRTIDTKTGMVAASGMLTAMHKPLFTGQSVRIHLFFGQKAQAKLVPLRAIKTNKTGAYVFSVKEDNTVEIRPVQLGHEEKGMIVVESGLEGSTKVVTEGHLRLFPGSKIEEVR